MRLPRLPRLCSLFLVPAVVFFVVAATTEDRALILILNIIQASVATTVEVAFLPEVIRIARSRGPLDRAEWVTYGIWISWLAVDYRTAESLVWRVLGQPSWIINSDITSAYLFMGTIGAVAHVVKPGGLGQGVPPREWIRIGAIIGSALAAGLLFLYWPDIASEWLHGHLPPR